MVSISFLKVGDYYCGFSAKGHTGFAEAGQDIVCAGISTLTQGISLGLIEVVKVNVEYTKEDSGELECRIVDGYENEAAQVLIKTLILALQNLQQSYPDCISISCRQLADIRDAD